MSNYGFLQLVRQSEYLSEVFLDIVTLRETGTALMHAKNLNAVVYLIKFIKQITVCKTGSKLINLQEQTNSMHSNE